MEMLIYFAKVGLYWVLFYLCYKLLLKQHTFFRWTRFYLIFALIVSTILPFITYPDAAPQVPVIYEATAQVTTIQYYPQPVTAGFTWRELLQIIYFVGVTIAAMLFLSKLKAVLHFIRNSEIIKLENYTIVLIGDNTSGSFSFLKWMVINKSDYEENLEEILRHEMVHIRQRHTLDILVVEVLKIVFWFNPILALYKRAIQEVHEFLADEDAPNRERYAYFLLNYARQTTPVTLTNHFFKSSQIKNRIRMIYKSRSATWLKASYAAALLLITAVALSVASCEKAKQGNVTGSGENARMTAAREITVRGKVTDTDQRPLPGANIVISGVQRGTTTNSDGNYEILAPSDSKLEFSFEGHQTFVTTVNNRTRIDVSLARADNSLLKSYVHPEDQTSDARATRDNMPNLLAPQTDENEVRQKSFSEPVFMAVDELPAFPGGYRNMSRFLARNLVYPIAATNASVSGNVFLSFIVGKDGTIHNIEVLKGIGFGCDEEAVRVVSSFPKWKAGKQNGVAVNVKYNLPIHFRIDADKPHKDASSLSRDLSSAPDHNFTQTFAKVNTLKNDILNQSTNTETVYHQSSPAIQIKTNGLGQDYDPAKVSVIVDGIINQNPNYFKTLKPESIARISVLKGDEAYEKFGYKNREAVILIETKNP